jgi:hypothetical protein
MFYKIYNVFDFVEYFCNGLVLFLSYDHLQILPNVCNFIKRSLEEREYEVHVGQII